jgi:SRSO17 transposase
VESWEDELEDVFGRVAGRFSRVEPRKRAFGYVRGLLAPLERRNGWTLAEQAGQRSPDGMQSLLTSPAWDPDAVRDDVRAYVVERIGNPAGVLIADETGFVKKGRAGGYAAVPGRRDHAGQPASGGPTSIAQNRTSGPVTQFLSGTGPGRPR